MFPHLRSLGEPDAARGGAPARVRRHHPRPGAAVPHPRVEPDAVRRRRSTTRRAGSSTRFPTGSSSRSKARDAPPATGPGVSRQPRGICLGARAASRRVAGRPPIASAWSMPRSLAGQSGRVGAPDHRNPQSLRIGDDVRHAKWGEGIVMDLEGSGDKAEIVIRFPRRERSACSSPGRRSKSCERRNHGRVTTEKRISVFFVTSVF